MNIYPVFDIPMVHLNKPEKEQKCNEAKNKMALKQKKFEEHSSMEVRWRGNPLFRFR